MFDAMCAIDGLLIQGALAAAWPAFLFLRRLKRSLFASDK